MPGVRAALLPLLWCALVAAGCDHGRNGETRLEKTAIEPPEISEDFALLPCPARPKSTLDYQGCAEHRILRSDRAIDAVAQTIFARLGARQTQARFVRAERTWSTYRRTTCESRSDVFYGGSAARIVFADCVADINRVHLRDLRSFAHDLRSR